MEIFIFTETIVILNPFNNIKKFYTNQLLLQKLYFVGLKYFYIFATCVCG